MDRVYRTYVRNTDLTRRKEIKMFIKLHSEGEQVAINIERIDAIQRIIVADKDKTQIWFGDDCLNVDESFDEVFSAVTSTVD